MSPLRQTREREVQVVAVADGRRLAVEVTGDASGTPVFLLHGTPGSRVGPKPRGKALYLRGVRLIGYDRPGYGGSTSLPGRTVADAATDVAAIADNLGLDTFAVVGRSGGGPHALACAALLPDRVTRAAVLVSLSRPDSGPDWFAGMNAPNRSDFRSVDGDSGAALHERAQATRDNPESLMRALDPDLTTADRRVVEDIAIRQQLLATYREAVRNGSNGWIDDVIALRRSWGFDLAAIRCPVWLWHGRDDSFAPASHSERLAREIPHAEVTVEARASHFAAVEVLPTILTWVIQS